MAVLLVNLAVHRRVVSSVECCLSGAHWCGKCKCMTAALEHRVHIFPGLLEVLQLLDAKAEHSVALDIRCLELSSKHLGVDTSFGQLELGV